MHVVRVSVDGEFMGEMKGGATLTLDVAAGARVVEVSGGGLSRTVTVHIDDGKTARYEMYFSNWGALGGGLNFHPVGTAQPQSPPMATSTLPTEKQRKKRWDGIGIRVSVVAIVLVVLFATSNSRDSERGTNHPDAVQITRISPAWPPELVAELKKAEEAARHLVAEDQEMRQMLPRLSNREFEAKRIAWTEKMKEMQARLDGALIALILKYGPKDRKLAEEYARIMRLLKPIAAPWPALP